MEDARSSLDRSPFAGSPPGRSPSVRSPSVRSPPVRSGSDTSTSSDTTQADTAADRRPHDRPNVVLLVMDTARADDVLQRPDVAPNLHRIARDGAAFETVFTTGPWTVPSHASLFTGQRTSEHGTHAGARQFDPSGVPLAERLRERGYHTAAFSNNSWVSPDFGFDRGFDEFRVGWDLFDSDADLVHIAKAADGRLAQARALAGELRGGGGLRTLAAALHATLFRRRYDDGARITNWRVARWLDGLSPSDRPFFLFVNYLEPHLEYRPPRGYRSQFLPEGVDYAEAEAVNQDAWAYLAGSEPMTDRDFEVLRALYRAELRYLDDRIGNLYDRLARRGELANTAVFVVGDHGENVGDHGLMDHQYSLHDTLLHVPLVCHLPEGIDAPPRRDGLRELRDCFPTILDLAGIEQPADPTVSARSLLDPRGRDHVVAEYATPQPDLATLRERVGKIGADLSQYDRGLRCIRTADWKLVEGTDGSAVPYRIADGEEVRASGDHAATVRERLSAWLHEEHGDINRPGGTDRPSRDRAVTDLDEGTRTRLNDLGYF